LKQPFDLPGYLTLVARELNIWDDVHHLFQDPKFDEKLKWFLQVGPKNSGKAGGQGMQGILQNKGSPMTQVNPAPSQDMNMMAQEGASQEQSMMQEGGAL
jgi:hypothetical protein